mmetsp:Transcript_21930/g.44802  ORF Transcript_21930/g.44802 Transcript_21930/m.44802 type:complete len:262 (+) Transcript_21930:181-966(+)
MRPPPRDGCLARASPADGDPSACLRLLERQAAQDGPLLTSDARHRHAARISHVIAQEGSELVVEELCWGGRHHHPKVGHEPRPPPCTTGYVLGPARVESKRVRLCGEPAGRQRGGKLAVVAFDERSLAAPPRGRLHVADRPLAQLLGRAADAHHLEVDEAHVCGWLGATHPQGIARVAVSLHEGVRPRLALGLERVPRYRGKGVIQTLDQVAVPHEGRRACSPSFHQACPRVDGHLLSAHPTLSALAARPWSASQPRRLHE